MGFGACGVGPSGFLSWGSLYKHRRMTLGKSVHPFMREARILIQY